MSAIPNPFVVTDDTINFQRGTVHTVLMNIDSAIDQTKFPYSVSPLPLASSDNTLVINVITTGFLGDVERVFTQVMPSDVATSLAEDVFQVTAAVLYELACKQASDHMTTTLLNEAGGYGVDVEAYRTAAGTDDRLFLELLSDATHAAVLLAEVSKLIG